MNDGGIWSYGYIFDIYTVRGVSLFLVRYDCYVRRVGKIAGGKMEKLLEKMTSNPVKSFALGAGITIAVQSSSAVTVMLVGFVNSGIMKLSQAIGIIMGSNVGTTITSWILSLSGIQSSNFILRLLKPESFCPLLALIAVILIMTSKITYQDAKCRSFFNRFCCFDVWYAIDVNFYGSTCR